MIRGLLVIAVDGLDWTLLQEQSTAGRMPHLARLLDRGVQARLAAPAGASESAAARWISIACGAEPARHGIAHDLVVQADGLHVARPSAADLRAPPLWQHAWQAGLGARVAAWPATQGGTIPTGAGPGSTLVADEFQHPEPGVQRAWPLAPDAVAPVAERALIRAARMHPAEVSDAMIAALLPGEAPLPALRTACAGLLARWASVHNLGVHWCEQGGAALVMLRFDGLPDWHEAAAACGLQAGAAQAAWLAWLDLLLGRYAALLLDVSHLVLVSDCGMDGGRSATAGGVLVAGPDTATRPALQDWPDTLPAEALLPILLDLLGQKAPQAMPERCAIDETSAPVLQDGTALAWLHAQGLAPVDLAALRQRAAKVREAAQRSLSGQPGA